MVENMQFETIAIGCIIIFDPNENQEKRKVEEIERLAGKTKGQI
jgi:hypothetical protein